MYANLVWGSQSDNKLSRINNIQNRLLRLIFRNHPALARTFFPKTIKQIHFGQICIFAYKLQIQQLPHDMQIVYAASTAICPQTIATRRGPTPTLPKLRTEYGRASLSYKLTSNYVAIKNNIQGCTTLNQLKYKLKSIWPNFNFNSDFISSFSQVIFLCLLFVPFVFLFLSEIRDQHYCSTDLQHYFLIGSTGSFT